MASCLLTATRVAGRNGLRETSMRESLRVTRANRPRPWLRTFTAVLSGPGETVTPRPGQITVLLASPVLRPASEVGSEDRLMTAATAVHRCLKLSTSPATGLLIQVTRPFRTARRAV